MSSDLSLSHRRRAPLANGLAAIAWMGVLDTPRRVRVAQQIKVGDALPVDTFHWLLDQSIGSTRR